MFNVGRGQMQQGSNIGEFCTVGNSFNSEWAHIFS